MITKEALVKFASDFGGVKDDEWFVFGAQASGKLRVFHAADKLIVQIAEYEDEWADTPGYVRSLEDLLSLLRIFGADLTPALGDKQVDIKKLADDTGFYPYSTYALFPTPKGDGPRVYVDRWFNSDPYNCTNSELRAFLTKVLACLPPEKKT